MQGENRIQFIVHIDKPLAFSYERAEESSVHGFICGKNLFNLHKFTCPCLGKL